MARILLTWELGSNLGHLSRLLPIASSLKERGHSVLVATREAAAAASLLGPRGIPFVQAPQAVLRTGGVDGLRSYAELLSLRGWGDANHLWGLVHAWVNLLRMFAPQLIVFDHSPTALLAARATSAHRVLVGTGFELPPREVPLPPFPGAGGNAHESGDAEALVLGNANRVLRSLRVPELESLAQLFEADQRWFTTVSELDHYGPRPGERYVGPIGVIHEGTELEWPRGASERLFAYLRPENPGLSEILQVLAGYAAAVICCIPGLKSLPSGLASRPDFTVSTVPVQLDPLLAQMSLCVSYAPAGTVTSTLLRGVPQLLAPPHVEAQLTAQRVEALGAGLSLRGASEQSSVASALRQLLATFSFRSQAQAFAQRYCDFDRSRATEEVVSQIGSLAAQSPQ